MVQSVVNGLISGILLALLASGFSLVYSTTGIFYVALGSIYTIAPYLLLSAMGLGLPLVVGLILAILAGALLAILSEKFIHWPLQRKGAHSHLHFISSLGLYLVVVQVVTMLWGSDAKVLHAGADRIYVLDSVRVTHAQLVGLLVAGFGLFAGHVLLRRSQKGLQLRALASNPPLLSVLGGDVRRLRTTVFAVSGALASLVSGLFALDVGFDPNVGMKAVLTGLAASIVGGRGSFGGAAIAGLLLGILRTQVTWHGSARWEDAATFVLLAACLVFLPGGLRGLSTGRSRLEEDK